MELFDKDGNAIELEKVAGELGFKTQADIDGAVGSAVERAKRTAAEKAKAELDEQYKGQLNSLQSELDAIRNKDDKESEYSKAIKLQLEQTQTQLQEMQKQREQDIREAKRAKLESRLAQAVSGKFSDDEAIMAIIEKKHINENDNGDFFFTNSSGANVELDALIESIMQERPGLVKSGAVNGVGGRETQAIKKEYSTLKELGADYEKFVVAGRQDDYEKERNRILNEKAKAVPENQGVAALGA